jgi:septum formation protein
VHQVCSAVFVGHLERAHHRIFREITQVRFKRLNKKTIRDYMARVNPLDKAGAYAAQGHGREIIAEIDGSYSNVVGLPLERTLSVLADFGIQATAA